jgi:spore maturation protein CgeB
MRIVIFCHSLVSDWNHGNAHFLRGVSRELIGLGHQVSVFEPANGWSRANLVAQHGTGSIEGFHRAYPDLRSTQYDLEALDLDRELGGADLVLVHEWNEPALVEAIGQHRAVVGGYRLLFHDTHHRSVTAPREMEAFDLEHYDGVLAFGEVIRQRYLDMGWAERAWTWHEAADVRLFRPSESMEQEGQLVWIGNWGDEERTLELEEYLIRPTETLGLRASAYGVRYPPAILTRLQQAGIRFRGWLPNADAPSVFARHRVTVHIPRRPYVQALPGVPTIRVFEALACGIPLICSPWDDVEGLFQSNDYLVARNGTEMRQLLAMVLSDPVLAGEMARRGRETILTRHTCAHRARQLLDLLAELNRPAQLQGAPRYE